MQSKEVEKLGQLKGMDFEEDAENMDFDEEGADRACDVFEDTGFDVTEPDYRGHNPFLRFRQWRQMRRKRKDLKKDAEINHMYTGRGF